jgi:hypothetical protein
VHYVGYLSRCNSRPLDWIKGKIWSLRGVLWPQGVNFRFLRSELWPLSGFDYLVPDLRYSVPWQPCTHFIFEPTVSKQDLGHFQDAADSNLPPVPEWGVDIKCGKATNFSYGPWSRSYHSGQNIFGQFHIHRNVDKILLEKRITEMCRDNYGI